MAWIKNEYGTREEQCFAAQIKACNSAVQEHMNMQDVVQTGLPFCSYLDSAQSSSLLEKPSNTIQWLRLIILFVIRVLKTRGAMIPADRYAAIDLSIHVY